MKKIFYILLVVLLIIVLTFCAVIVWSINYQKTIKICKSIDPEVVSSQELIGIAKSELDIHFDIEMDNLYVGDIVMYLNEEHRGQIIITFSDVNSPQSRYLIYFDTYEHILQQIHYFKNEPKISIDTLHPEQWTIDSIDLETIANNVFSTENDFTYDKVSISTSVPLDGAHEVWHIGLTDSDRNISYRLAIDAFTGEIRSKSIYLYS